MRIAGIAALVLILSGCAGYDISLSYTFPVTVTITISGGQKATVPVVKGNVTAPSLLVPANTKNPITTAVVNPTSTSPALTVPVFPAGVPAPVLVVPK